MPIEQRTCFVIMPYGKKKDAKGNEIDFDVVYKELIQEPIEALNIKPVRCDEIAHAGSIHIDMFEHIANDDVVIVDLTTLNPNVFYELGVRHALMPFVTVLIKAKDAPLPFNVEGLRTIDYQIDRNSRDKIRIFIENGLKSGKLDSPVYGIVRKRRDKGERIVKLQSFPFQHRDYPNKKIVVLTGDIQERRGIDVWVNSENTNMQMARFYDRGMSALIRYLGAKKDAFHVPIEDTIANELASMMKGRESVPPATVCSTTSGDLARTHDVKRIFHAAAVVGTPGSGYVPIVDVEKCVTSALRLADSERMRSIAFPMIGTGTGGADVSKVAPRLLQAAISYLGNSPATTVEIVYFVAWNQRDLDACFSALNASDEVNSAPEPITN
jgi:O-acetyl-ADP-ribose deacetylase (regulator of RNase III)